MSSKKQTPLETDETLHHVNDKAFKKVFLVKETALEYIHNYFPLLEKYLELEALEAYNTNYVNKDFDEYFSDVVYRTYLKTSPNDAKKKVKKKKVTVVLLFEHKKHVSSYFLLFFQLLEYIIFIWRQDIADKRKPSIVIPIVVYQGKRALRLKTLHDCFRGVPQELLKYIPNFHIHLTNIQPLTGKELLSLDEKGLLRSLFLAYIFVEDRNRIQDMVTEIFKFLKHQPEKFDFFEHIFAFVTQEGYLDQNEIDELLEKYLSPKQKEGTMTSVQEWRKEGKIEGAQSKARLVILRGKWKGATAEFLAELSELSLQEVKNLFKGYDDVFTAWQKNKHIVTAQTEHLTEAEITYLLDLFNKQNSWN
jgi:predicted transposase/invertase (TIGR01784 family)